METERKKENFGRPKEEYIEQQRQTKSKTNKNVRDGKNKHKTHTHTLTHKRTALHIFTPSDECSVGLFSFSNFS